MPGEAPRAEPRVTQMKHVATSTRVNLWLTLRALVALGLISYLAQLVNWLEVAQIARRADPAWLLTGTLYFPIAYFLYAQRTRRLVDNQLPLLETLRLVVVQGALSTFVANAAGTIAQVTLLIKRHSVTADLALRSAILTRLADLGASAIAVATMLLIAWRDFREIADWIIPSLGLAVGLLAGTIVAVRLIGTQSRKTLSRAPTLISNIARWRNIAIRAIDIDRAYAWRCGPAAFGYSLGLQIVVAASMYCNTQAFDLAVTPTQAAVVGIVAFFVGSLPVTILGGLGVYEASTIGLFYLYGVPVSESTAMMLVVRAVFYVLTGLALTIAWPWRLRGNARP